MAEDGDVGVDGLHGGSTAGVRSRDERDMADVYWNFC